MTHLPPRAGRLMRRLATAFVVLLVTAAAGQAQERRPLALDDLASLRAEGVIA